MGRNKITNVVDPGDNPPGALPFHVVSATQPSFAREFLIGQARPNCGFLREGLHRPVLRGGGAAPVLATPILLLSLGNCTEKFIQKQNQQEFPTS